MREFYNYAIDLGTTNSCIAKFEDGDINIFKNIDGMEVVPSAIYVNKNGRILVGKKAIEKHNYYPEDTVFEFKRLMGIKHNYLFKSSGKELSPIELSSEVLKLLKEEVYRINGEIVKNVVITVPSAFNSIQCDSTYKAGKLAGFKNIVLLQEPIAAAMSYEVDTSENKVYMVFDLGGGTLDVAIVSVVEGSLQVINHEGDNFLGSKDIDKELVDNIILREIKNKYKIEETNKGISFINSLLKYAEEAKKALSTTSEYILDIYDIGVDDDGREIDIQVVIKERDLEELASKIIKKCIKVAEKAITDSRINKTKIDQILLVGGGTNLKHLQNSLQEYFSIPLNTEQNPMTAVVKGASIYASEIYVKEDDFGEDIDIQLEYDNITNSINSNIIGKIINSKDIKEVMVLRENDGWSIGWKPIGNEYFDIDIELIENETNKFRIVLRDSAGKEIEIKNNQFSILNKENIIKPTVPLLPHTLSIEIEREGLTKLIKMINKNSPIPSRKIQSFKTSRALIPGEDDNLTIKLWEGESENPNHCEWVGNVYISAKEIKYPIPKDSKIDIDISIDISRRITISLYIEYSDIFKSDTKLYIQEPIDISKPLARIKQEISKLIDEATGMQKQYEAEGNTNLELNLLLSKLHGLFLENHKLFNNKEFYKESIMKSLGEIKELKFALDGIKNTSHLVENEFSGETQSKLESVENIINTYGTDENKTEFQEKKDALTRSKEENDRKGEIYYLNEIKNIENDIYANDIDIWNHYFEAFKKHRLFFINIEEADLWIKKGEEAKKQNSIVGLATAVNKLVGIIRKSDVGLVEEQFLPPDIIE